MIKRLLNLLMIIFILAACQPGWQSPGPSSVAILPSATQDSSPAPTQELQPESTAFITNTNTAIPPTYTTTPSTTSTPTDIPITTLLFTGVIVPARCVQEQIDQSGNADYPYAEVRHLIEGADLAVGTFNATMSKVAPHTGCVPTYVLVGSPENADAMAHTGFDVMSVATNHIKDCGLTNCGDQAFFETLENLERVGILAVGAGANHSEAMRPVVVSVHGVRFGFVSLGQIEQGGVYAEQDKPGIAVLTPENIRTAVAEARRLADVVIVMPHWGPEDVSTPNWIQRNLAHDIAATRPDLVVGNHTHVVQGIQVIDDVPIFYGLGNFVFDQWRVENQQGVILLVRFQGAQYLDYELIPTRVDKDGRVHIAGDQEALEILERIRQASLYLR
jgi:hypothetical protein